MSDFAAAIANVPFPWKSGLVDVTDTAELCLKWFRAQGIEPTPDALVAMTGLVIQHSASIKATE